MKTLLLVLLLAVICPLAGCSSNDESAEEQTESTVQTDRSAPEEVPDAASPPETSAPQETTTDAVQAPDATAQEQTAPQQEAPVTAAPEEEDILVHDADKSEVPTDRAAGSEPVETAPTAEDEIMQGTPPMEDNATAKVEEGLAEQEPEKPPLEATPGFTLPETLTADTAKSPNHPATPQVPETEDTMETAFGLEQLELSKKASDAESTAPGPEKKKTAEKKALQLSPAFGVETPEPAPQKTESAAAPEKKPEPEVEQKVAAKTPPAPEPKPEPEKAKPLPVKKKPSPKAVKAPKRKLFRRTANIREKSVEFLPTTVEGPNPILLTDAKQKFKNFAADFVAKINRSYLHTPGNPELVQENGTYKARYTELDKLSVALKIKQSKYEHTPFVGFMKYAEKIYEAQGDSPEAAEHGSFRVLKSTNVTEIFRFAKGAWIE